MKPRYAAALFLLLGSLMSQAQSQTQLVITVPFDFMVGKMMFPAGGYTIQPLDRQTFRLASQASYEFVVLKTQPRVTSSNRRSGGLLFVNDGHHYRLREVDMNAATTRRVKGQLPSPGELVWVAAPSSPHRQPTILRTGRESIETRN